MFEHGARVDDSALHHEGKLTLVELQNGAASRGYVAGTTSTPCDCTPRLGKHIDTI